MKKPAGVLHSGPVGGGMYLEVVYTTTGTGFVRESGPSAAFDTPNGCKRGNEGPTVHDLLKIAASSGGEAPKSATLLQKAH